jgi:hypothetical protein
MSNSLFGYIHATGLIASLKNACRQYGLTEEQVRQADLPCQYRSFRGNSYIVVKLSDMANLKATLQKQAKEAAKQKLIDELGEDEYAKRMAELKAAKMKEKADLEAAKVKKEKVDKLSSLLFDALAASEGGISPTLAGTTISMTAAEKEWRVKSHEIVGHLKPVDPTKTRLKYYLSDVIGVAHNKGASSFSAKLESSPDRRSSMLAILSTLFMLNVKLMKLLETRISCRRSAVQLAAVLKRHWANMSSSSLATKTLPSRRRSVSLP